MPTPCPRTSLSALCVALLAGTACRPPEPLAAPPAAGLQGVELVEGRLVERLAPQDNAQLVILYGAEERGDPFPCGCEGGAKGGLARQAAYAAATRGAENSPPVLHVNAGGWSLDAPGFDGAPRADAPLTNQWMTAGLKAAGVQVLNLGYGDIMGMRSLAGEAGLPVVSANISGPGVLPHHIVVVGGLRVGVTGITAEGSPAVPTPGYTRADPYRAGKAALLRLRPEVDRVVLLSQGATEHARRLADDGLVDVVIDANNHHGTYQPLQVGRAVWVRAAFQTERIGELRVGWGAEGALAWALDRKVQLDDKLPDEPDVGRLMRAAKHELSAASAALFGPR